jgi:putative restriction endonuclease
LEIYHDRSIREAVFNWLSDREQRNINVHTWNELTEGVVINGERITLAGATGIWIPHGFDMPISLRTGADASYFDTIGDDGILTYAYRGNDPDHRENRGLKAAMQTRTPMVYFSAIRAGLYQAAWPITIFQDDPSRLCVRAAIDPAYSSFRQDAPLDSPIETPLDVRRYITVQAKRRLHQGAFRELVLEAYSRRCAICRLQHQELLDAAHILADSEVAGLPIITNGLSLCKIHHAAFDQNILGVSPDYRIHIREDILREHDGPMLKHGLQELDGGQISLPRRPSERPDPERLSIRFTSFQAVS